MPRSMLQNQNVRNEIEGLLERFTDPDSLNFVSQAMFKRGIDIPSDSWSILNRLIMMRRGSLDARGPKAWFKIGRKVKKAGHFCIIAPKIIKVKAENENEEDQTRCIGFYPIAVWPVENTYGEDVEYDMDKPMPEFVGKELAESWGIEVTQGFKNPRYLGLYRGGKKKEIRMVTEDQQTFFHELVHAAEDRLGSLKKDSKEEKEIIADFASGILMNMFGLSYGEKNVYDYIKMYADRKDRDVIDSVIPMISRVSKVVNYIMDENDKLLYGEE